MVKRRIVSPFHLRWVFHVMFRMRVLLLMRRSLLHRSSSIDAEKGAYGLGDGPVSFFKRRSDETAGRCRDAEAEGETRTNIKVLQTAQF